MEREQLLHRSLRERRYALGGNSTPPPPSCRCYTHLSHPIFLWIFLQRAAVNLQLSRVDEVEGGVPGSLHQCSPASKGLGDPQLRVDIGTASDLLRTWLTLL